ncbi:hypothetical protein FS837_005184, partial [Tulasnella sp. UAMH 9824]
MDPTQDTDWPKQLANEVQALIAIVGMLPDCNRIRNDETQIRTEVKVSIKLLLKELESVRTRLEVESKKYGTRKKGFRREVKKLFSRVDPNDCAQVLKDCRNDVKESSEALNNFLSDPDPSNASKNSSQVTESQSRGDSGRQLGPQVSPAAGTLPLDVSLRPLTSPVQSDHHPVGAVPKPEIRQFAGLGKQKGSLQRRELLNGANRAFTFVEGVSGALPVVGGYVKAVAKVGLTIVEMVETMDENNETAERLGSHVCRLSNVLERFSSKPRQPETSQTANEIEDLRRTLQDVQSEIVEEQSQPGLKKFWNSSDGSGNLKKIQDKVRAALEEIQLLVNLKTSILVEELRDGKYGARGEVIEDVTCLPGTRVEILERIDNWVRAGANSERVLWIRGMAGRGKSTIASTVAHSWGDRACCAIYHFRRGQNVSNASLVCALSRQLARSLDPELRKAILSTVEERDDIINQRLDEQFAALFIASLKSFKNKSFPILIIVDALDECDSVDYTVNFVKLIDRHSSSLPDNLKFLLTSRPEARLLGALEPRKWHAMSLDSVANADADIQRFLAHTLLQVRNEHNIEDHWPTPDVVSELVKMSQGLFQWAHTVVKYVGNGFPKYRLGEILEFPKLWSGVDELYTQILSKALENVKKKAAKRDLLVDILGTLVTAPYPISLEAIAFLHRECDLVRGQPPGTVLDFLRREVLANLNSLLLLPVSPSEPIRLVHTSLRDLLVDRERCGGAQYYVDLVQNHQRLATVCIRQMNLRLKENICDLADFSKPSSELQEMVD